MDGVYQSKANYSISGSTLTFSTAPPSGAAVEVMTMTQTEINVPVDGTITSAKLSGDLVTPGALDVTGTVTADGGTIVSTGSDAFSSKAVGGYAIQAYQDATSSGHTALDLRSDATTDTRYLVRGYNDAAGTPTEVFSVGADGSAFLNSNVGIGTSSVNRALEIAGNNNGGAKANYIRITDTDTSATANNQQGGIEFYTNDVTAGICASMEVLYAGSGGGGEITFNTNASSSGTLTEALRIDENQKTTFKNEIDISATTKKISWRDADDTFRAGIQAVTTGGQMVATSAANDFAIRSQSNMLFATGGNAERVRISSAGHTSFGTSNLTPADNSVNGTSILNDGRINHNAQSQPAAVIGRTGTDGALAVFRKSGVNVGSIGTVSNGLYIASPVSSDSGLRFSGSTVHPCTTSGAPRDNAVDLGYAQGRFDDIYATNGTIQTSDRNEKQDIEALTDAEQRVAVAAKGLLRKFRWISSVEENGDDARIHFGIIAQDLQDAFTAEGLDAGRYAMFISSTWTDEDTGEERTRLGVRYSELLAFIISAI